MGFNKYLNTFKGYITNMIIIHIKGIIMNSLAYKTTVVFGKTYRVTGNKAFISILDSRGNICFELNIAEKKACQPCNNFRRYCSGIGIAPGDLIKKILNSVN